MDEGQSQAQNPLRTARRGEEVRRDKRIFFPATTARLAEGSGRDASSGKTISDWGAVVNYIINGKYSFVGVAGSPTLKETCQATPF